MAIYTCEVCGKHLKPVVIWQCVEDNEALHRGETVASDHFHQPDVMPGDAIDIGAYRSLDEPMADAPTEQGDTTSEL